jgi:hypothetical protein
MGQATPQGTTRLVGQLIWGGGEGRRYPCAIQAPPCLHVGELAGVRSTVHWGVWHRLGAGPRSGGAPVRARALDEANKARQWCHLDLEQEVCAKWGAWRDSAGCLLL